MNPRPAKPYPDPGENIAWTPRSIVAQITTLVIRPTRKHLFRVTCPILSPAIVDGAMAEEVALDDVDLLQAGDFSPCPDDVDFSGQRGQISATPGCKQIAQWAFDTYSKLVFQRITTYNKWRRVVNSGQATLEELGQYRCACRLAIEQMTRRDLPQVADLDWNSYQPMLPVSSIQIKLTS